jgi:hypothetical protein
MIILSLPSGVQEIGLRYFGSDKILYYAENSAMYYTVLSLGNIGDNNITQTGSYALMESLSRVSAKWR